ncbi:hypothetical protein AB1L88_23435 [Tautonia sp. JC769]|uniref:hypothetical protein n=1 Tax=Tautonia sp. JC769 TaxID=3232135 RepID=UPI003458205D
MSHSIRVVPIAILLVVGVLVVSVTKLVLQPEPFLSAVRSSVLSDTGNPPTAHLLYTTPPDPFEQSPEDRQPTQLQFQNQLQLMTSDRVLSAALLDRTIGSLDLFNDAEDPVQVLRDHLKIRRVDESSLLIEISAHGLPQPQGARVVNTVVDEFIKLDIELTLARSRAILERLEASRSELGTLLQSHFDELTRYEQFSLSADGPSVSRSAIEAELLDCLAQLRRVRLDRAALPPDADPDALAPIDRQEAELLAERDRLAKLNLRANLDAPRRVMLQGSIDQLLELRSQVEASLWREQLLDKNPRPPWTVISPAE